VSLCESKRANTIKEENGAKKIMETLVSFLVIATSVLVTFAFWFVVSYIVCAALDILGVFLLALPAVLSGMLYITPEVRSLIIGAFGAEPLSLSLPVAAVLSGLTAYAALVLGHRLELWHSTGGSVSSFLHNFPDSLFRYAFEIDDSQK
jgi:hypothetical protein